MRPGKMLSMLTPSQFREVVSEMREVNDAHFFCDLRRDCPQPHWSAQTWENIPRDDVEARLPHWLRLGTRPHTSLVITADEYYVGVHLLVRGQFSEDDNYAAV